MAKGRLFTECLIEKGIETLINIIEMNILSDKEMPNTIWV